MADNYDAVRRGEAPGSAPPQSGDAELLASLHRRARLLLSRFGVHKRWNSESVSGDGDGVAARLYFCAQALFKFHPAFIAALANILLGDPKGHLLLIRPAATTSSSRSWSESISTNLRAALEARLRASGGMEAELAPRADDVMSRVHWTARLSRQVRANSCDARSFYRVVALLSPRS